MAPDMHPVDSSAIEMVGYDPDDSTLAITFTGGATYLYPGVPSSVYEALLAADSKGRFVNTFIKPIYPAVRQ